MHSTARPLFRRNGVLRYFPLPLDVVSRRWFVYLQTPPSRGLLGLLPLRWETVSRWIHLRLEFLFVCTFPPVGHFHSIARPGLPTFTLAFKFRKSLSTGNVRSGFQVVRTPSFIPLVVRGSVEDRPHHYDLPGQADPLSNFPPQFSRIFILQRSVVSEKSLFPFLPLPKSAKSPPVVKKGCLHCQLVSSTVLLIGFPSSLQSPPRRTFYAFSEGNRHTSSFFPLTMKPHLCPALTDFLSMSFFPVSPPPARTPPPPLSLTSPPLSTCCLACGPPDPP